MKWILERIQLKWLILIIGVEIFLAAPLMSATVLVSWNPNSELDLAGYKIFYGTAPGQYSVSIDVGNVTQYEISGLAVGTKYYFAVKAYDLSWNESEYSDEVPYRIEDIDPPTIVSATCGQIDRVTVVFSEPVESTSAENDENYTINGGIVVQRAELQTDLKTVHLYTTQHPNGNYTLTVSNVKDTTQARNVIANGTQVAYTWEGNDETPPAVVSVELYRKDFLVVTYSEPVDQTTASTEENYSISPSIGIVSATIDASFEKVYLTTGLHAPGQTYTLTINNVTDGAEPPNTIAANTQVNYDCVAEDTEPPIMIAARLESTTELELEFNEALDETTAETVANYSITPSVTVHTATLSGSGTKVTLITDVHSGGNYTITASGVADDADPPNVIESTQLEYTYTPPDVTPPTLVSAELTSDDLLQVTFNEPMDETSAENVNNYAIEPQVNILRATLDVSQVKVLLETASHSAGNYSVIVSGVNDKADPPNTIASNSSVDYTYDPPDTSPPRLLSAELNGSNMVELIFSESLDRTSSEDVSHYQITPSVDILSASLEGEALDKVYLQTENHQPGETYTVTVEGVMDRASIPNEIAAGVQASYDYPLIDTTPPRLESAQLQSERFLKLGFSESLDKTSAQNTEHYTIDPPVVVEEATLDASLKIVLLRTEAHQPGDYTVTVTGVMDRADPQNTIDSDNQMSYTCESRDVEPPLLLRAELHGMNLLELNFNEPLESSSARVKTNYSIDNGIVVQGVSLSQSQMEVFLETSAHSQGTYKVTVNGVRDLAAAPNTIQTNSWVSYTYTPTDTMRPALLSATLVNPTMVELNFSETLDRISAETVDHYAINSGIIVERAILDFSGTRVILQTTSHIPGAYILTLNGIKDASAARNTILANTTKQYAYVTADDVPPHLVSAELKSGKMLVVTFSEPLDRTNAQEKVNYVINNNVQVNGVFMASTDDRQVIVETSDHAAGEYVLTVNGITDASTAKNAIAPYSQIQYTWDPPDTVGPELVSATLHTNSFIELVFNEPIDGIESQKVENYQIEPSLEIMSAVLDGNWTKVYLCTEPHSPGSYTITVVNVTDRAFTPNTIDSKNSVEYRYIPPDTDPPALISVQLRTPMSLALHFDEEISRTSAENPANYTITPDIEVKEAFLLSHLKTVHLETSPHQPSINYVVEIRNIQDRAPTPNKLSDPLTAEYSYAPPDTTPPKLLSAKLQGANLLELVFNKELEQLTAENRENYKINPSVEVLNAGLDPTSLTRVYLETTTHMPGISYDINVQNVKDRAPIPNTIRPNTWLSYSMSTSGGSSDRTPPRVARVDVISAIEIDVVFTEPVEKASAENKDNYDISGSVAVRSARLDSDMVKVRLTTSAHQMGSSYDILVKNIRDNASQSNVLTIDSPVKYILSQGVSLSNPSRAGYDFSVLQLGGSCFADRNYTIEELPEDLQSALQILTANDDKSSMGDNFFTFEIRGDATVFIAYDKRITQIPDWLAGWKFTGEQVADSRSGVYNLYSKQATAGRMTLGGNGGSMDDNMYMIFVKPHMSSGAVLASLNKASYQAKHIEVGDAYYIDRDYTIASIPDTLEGLLWIQTANDDKIDHSEEFLCFTLNWASRVYVGYDANIETLPDWLLEDEEWQMIDDQIVDRRGSRFDIFYKEYPAGQVVLGGNCGTMDDNMYLVMIQPIETQGPRIDSEIPGYFTLTQNYPNPFNPTTTIPFKVHKKGLVKLTIYNILGQRVKVLIDREFGSSEVGILQEITWDGTDEMGNRVASGLYLYRIQQSHFAKTRRMILMR